MKPLKMSTVFRRACDLVACGDERYRYSCDAIDTAAESLPDGSRCPQAKFFWREHFTPSVDSPESYWLVGTGMTEAEKHEWRLVALMLAEAMTKAEKA